MNVGDIFYPLYHNLNHVLVLVQSFLLLWVKIFESILFRNSTYAERWKLGYCWYPEEKDVGTGAELWACYV